MFVMMIWAGSLRTQLCKSLQFLYIYACVKLSKLIMKLNCTYIYIYISAARLNICVFFCYTPYILDDESQGYISDDE